MNELAKTERDAWQVELSRVDTTGFVIGRLGPYRLGPTVRRTPFGEVILAVDEERRELVELDMFDALARTPLAGPDGKVMADIAHVVGLSHRHISTVIGSGFDNGVPYVVREHRLGVTLHDLFDRASQIADELAAALMFSVADALAFLETQGPAPGTCAMGGFDAHSVFLGFDGAIRLVGIGLQKARGQDNPLDADLSGCFAFARELDKRSEGQLVSTIAAATDLTSLATSVRRRHREACGARALHVASALRKHFATEIGEARAFFGLRTLQ